MINQTHRSMSILVDGKKAKDQFALEWASGDDLSHEGSIFLMNYQPSGREKMQKLIADHMIRCYQGPGLPLLIEGIEITLRGAHMTCGFISYLTVPIAKRIQDIEAVLAELPTRGEDFYGDIRRSVLEKHRLDTKNFNGIIRQDNIGERDELQKYVGALKRMEKKWTLDDIAAEQIVKKRRSRSTQDN